jgi:hypothetical protein
MTLDNPISDEEIHKVLFSLKDNKAPIPNGFNAGFLKKAWTIIGLDTGMIQVNRCLLYGGGSEDVDHFFIVLSLIANSMIFSLNASFLSDVDLRSVSLHGFLLWVEVALLNL